MMRPFLALALLLGLLLPAAAEEIDLFPEGTFDLDPRQATPDDADETEEQARLSALYCDRFGPDFVLVAGTTTCIRVGGHVQMDVYIRGRR